jgi:16S rRNA processing protein RimM
VTVGRIGRPRGLDGELYVHPESDAPDRFSAGAAFLTDESPPRTLRVVQARQHQGRLLVRFSEIVDRTAAESLRGAALTISTGERRRLTEGEFWPDELIGLTAIDLVGQQLGRVSDVDVDGPQVRLVVETRDGFSHLVPFVRELVPEVRIAEGTVVINPIEGLFNSSQD